MNLLPRKHIQPNNTRLEDCALPPLQSHVFIEEIIIIWFNVLVNPETTVPKECYSAGCLFEET